MPNRGSRAMTLAISEVVVEVLRSGPDDIGLSPTEKLVGHAVVLSTYGPHPMGLNKLAEVCGLPRTTVRRALAVHLAKGTTIRNEDGTYGMNPDFAARPDRIRQAVRRFRTIKSAVMQGK